MDSVVKHRKYWVNNVPGFANMIVSTDLSSLEIPDEDIDVIEQLNIIVMKKMKPSLVKKIGLTEPKEDYIKTMVRVFQELVLEVSKINMGTKKNPSFLRIDDDSCSMILDRMFPSCVGIFTPPDSMPVYLTGFSTGFVGFENVDPEIFWVYFQYLHVYSGSELGTTIVGSWSKDKKVRARIKQVSDQVYARRENPLDLTNDQKLRMSIMAGKLDLYSNDGCPSCEAAKESLLEGEIKFDLKDAGSIPAVVQAQLDLVGHSTVPVVVIDGVFVGGNDELQRILKAPLVRPNIRV
jgi:glutaredoxin